LWSDQRDQGFAILQPILQCPLPIRAPVDTASSRVHEHRVLAEHPTEIRIQMAACLHGVDAPIIDEYLAHYLLNSHSYAPNPSERIDLNFFNYS
jgi:hypothetical protein